MSVTAEEVVKYHEQKVVLVYTPTGKNEAVQVEGTAEAANKLGVLLKPKGRQNLDLITLDQIEEIRPAPEKLKEFKQQDMQVVKYGSGRKHLLDRHGYDLAGVNAATEEDALSAHVDIDHTALGHSHSDKKDTATSE